MEKYDISFLKKYPPLDKIAPFAVSYLQTDPNGSMLKQGMMLEHIISEILKVNNLYKTNCRNEGPNLNEMLEIANDHDLLPDEERIDKKLYWFRKDRNDAAHKFISNQTLTCKHLEFILHFSKWFIDNWAKFEKKSTTNPNSDDYLAISSSVMQVSEPLPKYDYSTTSEGIMVVSDSPLSVKEYRLPLQNNETVLEYTRRTIKLFSFHD